MIVNFLRGIRKAKRINQDQVAARMDMSRGRISQLEQAPWHEVAPHLPALSRALDVSPGMILITSDQALTRAVREICEMEPDQDGDTILAAEDVANLKAIIT
ncbi:helix-turn-helix transcriptional regulator [uncultured Pelagimonas sp.]|uniref:helix-turn-helix domain-containing protein n=1 Tax=uncultured Pelagimonas sp. TaxID=1618102 RepID=UPI00260431DC|nr:helix-turn-helix transcriptional regulator [uncultured Pelagimonas sp.]